MRMSQRGVLVPWWCVGVHGCTRASLAASLSMGGLKAFLRATTTQRKSSPVERIE
jgi:hypothetical protein